MYPAHTSTYGNGCWVMADLVLCSNQTNNISKAKDPTPSAIGTHPPPEAAAELVAQSDKTKQTGCWSSLKHSIVKHRLWYIGLLSVLCVLCVSKSSCWQTLAVAVMVIVCQSLGGGAAQRGAVCVCVCECAHTAGVAWSMSHRAPLNSRVINPFNLTRRGCVCVFRCLKKFLENSCH